MFTVQRFFILNSRFCYTMRKSLREFKLDIVQIMPCLLFKEIEKIIADGVSSIIFGGMIEDKQTAIKLLSIGAMACLLLMQICGICDIKYSKSQVIIQIYA